MWDSPSVTFSLDLEEGEGDKLHFYAINTGAFTVQLPH